MALHCSLLTTKSPEQECVCVQADLVGPGCVDVADQLAQWGLFGQMKRFGEQCQAACCAQYGGERNVVLDDRLNRWNDWEIAIEEVIFLADYQNM